MDGNGTRSRPQVGYIISDMKQNKPALHCAYSVKYISYFI
jgi:hypothetical protein